MDTGSFVNPVSSYTNPSTNTIQERNLSNKNNEEAPFATRSDYFGIQFLSEVFIIIGLSILAYFLRFTNDAFVPFNYLVPCNNQSLHFYPTVPDASFYVNDTIMTVFLFVLPMAVIILGECFRFGIGSPSVKMIIYRNMKIPPLVRRIIRFEGCFYMGLLFASIMADMLQCLINRPGPQFVKICLTHPIDGTFICPDEWIDQFSCFEENQAKAAQYRRSFPNHRSVVTAYAAVYGAWYLHTALQIPGVYTIRPLIAAGSAALCLLASLSDWALVLAHWEDVAVGLAMGIIIGIYIVSRVHYFHEIHDVKLKQYTDLQDLLTERNQGKALVESITTENLLETDTVSRIIPRIQAINGNTSGQDTATSVTPFPSVSRHEFTGERIRNGYRYENEYSLSSSVARHPPILAYNASRF